MIPRPPRSTRTDPLFPYTTLFRSPDVGLVERAVVAAPAIALVDGAVPVELVIPCRCPGRRLHREFGAGMELVAARARHGVDDTTGAAAELRRIAAGLDLELFVERERNRRIDRKSTRLNSSH